MNNEKNTIGDLEALKLLYNFGKNYKFKINLSLGFIFLSSIFSIFSSKFLGSFLEKGLAIKNMKNIIFYGCCILISEGFSLYFIWQGRKKLAQTASDVIFSIREKLFLKLNALPFSYFDNNPQGMIVTRITHEVEGIEEFFTSSLGNFIAAFFMTTIALIAMLISDFYLGLIMFMTTMPAIYLLYKSKVYLRKSNRKTSGFSSAINSKLSEYVNGIELIRSKSLENWTDKNFKKVVAQYKNAQLKGNTLFSWTMPLVSFLASLPLFGLVWFGGKSVLKGTMKLGMFVSFVRYYERYLNPLMLLAREVHLVQQAFTSTERIYNFLNEKTEEDELFKNGNLIAKNLKGEINFNEVSMSYDLEKKVLNSISFEILKGEKIGLVGRTGCGKTSLVSLLNRSYEFQSGEIIIDHHSIRDYERNSLRQEIGIVSQDVQLFKGTLKENLLQGYFLSDGELFEACKNFGLNESLKINTIEDFNLEVLDNGINFSVGQKQLIQLIRILLKNPSILILDEATANIDKYHEEKIHEALFDRMKNKTCLIIAHRLDTLKECDRIFYFDRGQLIESGPYQELLNLKKNFYELQKSNYNETNQYI